MFKEPEPIYNNLPYTIYDEVEYFPVFRDYKQIAAFKKKEDAFEYVAFLNFKPDVVYFPV